MADKAKGKKNNGGNLGFEETLWATADKLRGNVDAAEYKHVVLGLIFLKYISDAFDERRRDLLGELADEGIEVRATLETWTPSAAAEVEADLPEYVRETLEDRDEYLASSVFFVPQAARWAVVQGAAKTREVGKIVDAAMEAVEKENARLKGVLPKDYGREQLDKRRLGELIDLVGTIGLGDRENQSKDVLGRVYEYFVGKFASAEGKKGGEFYTPRSVVRVLVEMLEPRENQRIYDPCCGSGGMYVQSERFIEAHGGRKGRIAVYGQEANHTTWRLCQMNLAIRGIEGHIAQGDTLHADKHKDLRADVVIANPPFNVSDWGGEGLKEDARWKHGTPPASNANFAWVQHFLAHLAPNGVAGFVLANGSLSANQSGEGDIRKSLVEADLVDCIVALPGQLFYNTGIPVCLWFLARNKEDGKLRDRRGQTLFIDARKMGALVDRTRKELSDEEIALIARTYHAWRGEREAGAYADVAGFCRSAGLADVREHGHVLTPGRYVGTADALDEDEPFEVRMPLLVAKLEEQLDAGARLDAEIRKSFAVWKVAP